MRLKNIGHIRRLLLTFLVVLLVLGNGCSPKPISKETLDYFYGLENQQYWQRSATGLALNDEYGKEQSVIAPTGTSDKQQYVIFGDVTVTASNTEVGPIDALIKARVFDGTTEKDVRVRVDDANLAMLQKTLNDAFESKVAREQRLGNEEYAAKLKEADAFLAANRVADAIAALKAAQAIKDSDEIKTRLDAIYLNQGKYYYAQKKYDVAVAQLKLVSFDSTSIAEAKELISTATAAMNTPKAWVNVFTISGKSPTTITRKFTIDSVRWLLIWTGRASQGDRMGANGVWMELYDNNGERVNIDSSAIVWGADGGATAHLYGAGTYTVICDISAASYLVAVSQWK